MILKFLFVPTNDREVDSVDESADSPRARVLDAMCSITVACTILFIESILPYKSGMAESNQFYPLS